MDTNTIYSMEEISKSSNKSKIAIVAVGYNRLLSLSRLLDSLSAAEYSSNDVPLVLCIDASGHQQLYDYVKNFEWKHGEKYVIIQKERLGLKKHIYFCGDLTRYFKAVVLLEDDLYVSPYFYDYVEKTVEKYGDNPRVSQISLYKNEGNGYAGLPFHPLENGNDVFLLQDVSTWGECWTEQMWYGFKEWLEKCSDEDIMTAEMPVQIKRWDRAWSKYFNAYVDKTNRFNVFPYIPLSTNFGDVGEHGGSNNANVQVHMLWGKKNYVFGDFDTLERYDFFFNNEKLYEWLGMKEDEVCLNLYGNSDNVKKKRYILTTKLLPYKVVKSYGLSFKPIELNIKFSIPGDAIFLYDTCVSGKCNKGTKSGYTYTSLRYFLQNYRPSLIKEELVAYYKNMINNKLRKVFKR